MGEDEKQHPYLVAYPNGNASGADISIHTPGSWRTLPFGRKKRAEKLTSKSMTLPRIRNLTPTKTPTRNRGRKGFARRWKKLYRSSSWEMRAYTHHYGHRSSIGAGTTAEFPDLECIPGIGDFEELKQRAPDDIDGTVDSRQHGIEPSARAREESLTSTPASDNHDWMHTYRDCVGSLSALKSNAELGNVGSKDEEDPHFYSIQDRSTLTSTDLRDSTVNFAAHLSKKHEEAKAGLLTQISKMDH